MQTDSFKYSWFRPFTISIILCWLFLGSLPVHGQAEKSVIRGKIAYNQDRNTSWDHQKLFVPLPEIEAELRQQIIHIPPYPPEFANWNPEKRLEWESKFVESDPGKKFLEERKRLFEEALAFDIKFEQDGSFVVFDVPPGVYSLQGHIAKTIGKVEYGFEIFAQIQVTSGVDEIALQPLQVEITPFLQPGQPAPPLSVNTKDDNIDFDLASFKENVIFVNFWSAKSPTSAAEQKMIQDRWVALDRELGVKLISINIDQAREEALTFIVDHDLKGGRHGFTEGFEHRALFDYGVRSFPSFWLIKDGKILMTQIEFAQAMRVDPNLETIISNRLLGKDTPTPANSDDRPSPPGK